MTHDQLIKEIERREYYNSMTPFPVYDTEFEHWRIAKANLVSKHQTGS